MQNSFIHKTRVLLIQVGKILPFIVCVIVGLSYVEDLYSLITRNLVVFDNSLVLNKPISWCIGTVFEYNLTTIVILLIISVAIETCYWNKLAILYLAIQLIEKDYFSKVELYEECIYPIIILNLIVCAFFVFKGIRILTKQFSFYAFTI